MKQNAVILDTKPLIERITKLYPDKPIHVLVKMLSRIVIIFLSTPVEAIDRELGYAGFYPHGFDPKLKEGAIELFELIAKRIKTLWPQATIEYIRTNACLGYQNIPTQNQWVLILADKENIPPDSNFIIL